jgi:hypothetical protein
VAVMGAPMGVGSVCCRAGEQHHSENRPGVGERSTLMHRDEW